MYSVKTTKKHAKARVFLGGEDSWARTNDLMHVKHAL